MTITATGLSTANFGELIAARVRAAHQEIAQRWLERLQALLPVEPEQIFPSDQLLDHVPALILQIADYLAAEPTSTLVADTHVFSKARALGELRFEQRASVHQLLREYRLLAAVLGTFIQEQFDALDVRAQPVDAAFVANRLSDAVFVLLQTTTDTFVGRYTDMIDEQTTRLEGFNRMVSHELRQPLTAIQFAVELLRGPAGDGEARERYLEVAERNVRRLTRLVGMLGALARPQQDNPQLQEVDLSKMVPDVLGQLQDVAERRGVSLRWAGATRLLTVDVSRLELVLVNLVSNGIKYRDPAKDNPFVEVALLDGDRDGHLHLAVRDNGLGIPAQDRSDVFRRFFRGHASRDEELGNDGVGLGLAIVAECVKALRGRIAFESAEGVGTTFTIVLPTARPDSPA